MAAMRTLQPSMMPMTAHRSLRVSAERGETEEELEFLRSHLCNEVQGYSSLRTYPLVNFIIVDFVDFKQIDFFFSST